MEYSKNSFTAYERLSLLRAGLLSAARRLGFDGSPILDWLAPIGTLTQELQIIGLTLDVQPRPKTESERKVIARWARNIVMTSTIAPKIAKDKVRSRKW